MFLASSMDRSRQCVPSWALLVLSNGKSVLASATPTPCHHCRCLTDSPAPRAGSMRDYGRAAEHAPADDGDWGAADDGDREGGSSLHLTDCCRDSAASLVLVSAPSGELFPDDAVMVVPAADSSGQAPRFSAGVQSADSRSGGAASGPGTASRPQENKKDSDFLFTEKNEKKSLDRWGTGAETADEAGGRSEPMRASWPAPKPRSPQESATRSLSPLAGRHATTETGDDAEDDTVASTREWLRQLSGGVPDPPAESAREAAEERAGGHSAPEQTSLWPCATGAGPAVCDAQLAGRTQRAYADQTGAADSPQCSLEMPAEAMLESWPAPAGCSAAVGGLRPLQAPGHESAVDSMREQNAAPQDAAEPPVPGLALGTQAPAPVDDDTAAIVLDGWDAGSTEKTAGAGASSAEGLAGDKPQALAAAGAHRMGSRARWHTLLPQSWLG